MVIWVGRGPMWRWVFPHGEYDEAMWEGKLRSVLACALSAGEGADSAGLVPARRCLPSQHKRRPGLPHRSFFLSLM